MRKTSVRKYEKMSDGSYYIQKWDGYGDYFIWNLVKKIITFPFIAIFYIIKLPFRLIASLYKKMTYGKTGVKKFIFGLISFVLAILILIVLVAFVMAMFEKMTQTGTV